MIIQVTRLLRSWYASSSPLSLFNQCICSFITTCLMMRRVYLCHLDQSRDGESPAAPQILIAIATANANFYRRQSRGDRGSVTFVVRVVVPVRGPVLRPNLGSPALPLGSGVATEYAQGTLRALVPTHPSMILHSLLQGRLGLESSGDSSPPSARLGSAPSKPALGSCAAADSAQPGCRSVSHFSALSSSPVPVARNR
ncbi:hypothetical protein HPB50_014088 [Hyalomma asiaticum]|uniref:Uncharacterized protein n=1 Tax=Hyalomma asiaticum TaxID=266040 RepID=A0ACB7S9A9_HYAAI|nr:hypothetical protein HPB50_014088 [Hyalomma asiaticum]